MQFLRNVIYTIINITQTTIINILKQVIKFVLEEETLYIVINSIIVSINI